VKAGRVAIGTVDSYLIARLTGGRSHITDVTNASRTQLFNLRSGDWDDDLLELYQVPRTALPEVCGSSGEIAQSDPACFLGLALPIAGIAGDQQAALFGHAAFSAGDSKCTYGTGSFILTNTGAEPQFSERGLLTTVAWQLEGEALTYATEGSVFATGAAVQWLRDGLGIIDGNAEVETLALEVEDTGGVVFVPAFVGLGAPHWDPHARASLQGITRGTTASHIARAVLESIAFSVKDVVDVMRASAGGRLGALRVDGGPTRNDLLMQLQADALGVSVHRSAEPELTALGAAYLAGIGTRCWNGVAELSALARPERVFEPSGRSLDHVAWRRAVERSLHWAG
jgi:glycerol kinase